ncbi:unnamed protein product [Cuscuta epithymum]|uniref:Uncharacterized protein n=1 Tax=Cuscuta epithymum TaxID=186058 RepID=A0AAV0EGB3_9ASTE|nr:unnamed protein product [Cuscuta epithymum]
MSSRYSAASGFRLLNSLQHHVKEFKIVYNDSVPKSIAEIHLHPSTKVIVASLLKREWQNSALWDFLSKIGVLTGHTSTGVSMSGIIYSVYRFGLDDTLKGLIEKLVPAKIADNQKQMEKMIQMLEQINYSVTRLLDAANISGDSRCGSGSDDGGSGGSGGDGGSRGDGGLRLFTVVEQSTNTFEDCWVCFEKQRKLINKN